MHRQTLFALRLAKRPGEVHSKPACHADRPGRAGVANADRESKLVGMPVPWTCDLDRTSRSCRVFCSLQCMACVHWSTQATAAALVHRQMAMRPLWRRSNAEGHRHLIGQRCVRASSHIHILEKKTPRRPLSLLLPLKKAFERVEPVSSLSKLKSVLVTDSHAQLLQRPCSATYGHEQRRRRLPSSSGDAPPIARGTSCPGHVLVPWAHSPIWSRQDPIFVSLTQIASYKR